MRTAKELENASRQIAVSRALVGINNVIAIKGEMASHGTGDAGGGGVINLPAVDPETGDFVEVALVWVPDRDAVGSVVVG